MKERKLRETKNYALWNGNWEWQKLKNNKFVFLPYCKRKRWSEGWKNFVTHFVAAEILHRAC